MKERPSRDFLPPEESGAVHGSAEEFGVGVVGADEEVAAEVARSRDHALDAEWGGGAAGVGEAGDYKRHLGIYAYRKDFLMAYTELPSSFLEQTEKLEQLRAIENGYTILTAMVGKAWDGVDTEQQYKAFVQRMRG